MRMMMKSFIHILANNSDSESSGNFLNKKAPALMSGLVVAGAGFEPTTFGL